MGRFVAKRPSVTKIEDRLVNFELKSSTSESQESAGISQAKKDLPKVDITKRREMFEKEKTPDRGNRSSGDFTQAAPLMSIRERMSNLEKQKEETSNSNSAGTVASNRLSGDLTSIKDRLKNLEKENGSGVQSSAHSGPKFDVPLGGSIKDRLSSLHSATAATAGVPAAADALPVSAKAAVVVGMAKKPQPVVEIDQVIEVETLKIEIEQIQLIPTTPMATAEPDSLMMMDSIQDVAQDYVTVKEEFREITDEDLFGGTDIELDDHLQQQDMSVSSATATVVSIAANVSMDSDSLEDVSQLGESHNTSAGVQVIETLTILGDLLQRSASNNNLVEGSGGGSGGKVEQVRGEEAQQPQQRKQPVAVASRNSNPRPALKMMAQSQSENSLLTATTNRANNNHLPAVVTGDHQQRPLKSSQSAFFDTNSGDRYCILLINNSRR